MVLANQMQAYHLSGITHLRILSGREIIHYIKTVNQYKWDPNLLKTLTVEILIRKNWRGLFANHLAIRAFLLNSTSSINSLLSQWRALKNWQYQETLDLRHNKEVAGKKKENRHLLRLKNNRKHQSLTCKTYGDIKYTFWKTTWFKYYHHNWIIIRNSILNIHHYNNILKYWWLNQNS